MIRRIFLNFSRKIPWTLCRIFLFMLMLGCFFSSMLMNGLTKQVNAQLVSNADLFVSVYTSFSSDLLGAKDSETARQVINDYCDMTRTLDTDGNAMYSDVPLSSQLEPLVREISWPLPEEEKDNIEGESEENLSTRAKRKKETENYILTKKAVFVDKETAASLLSQLELKRMIDDVFNDSAKRVLRNVSSRTELISIEHADFLKHHLGVVSLVSGRLMTQEEVDNGAAVCLVPADSGIMMPEGYTPIAPGDRLQLTFCQYSEEIEELNDSEIDFRLLDSESIEFVVVGTYESSELDADKGIAVYIPRSFFIQILDAQGAFFETHETIRTQARDMYKEISSHPLIFQFDSIEHINAFIQNLWMLPEYKNNDIQYYANIDQTLHMLSGFYGMAGGVRSMLSIFGIIAVAFSILIAVLDVFYRRREIAVLQSMGESPGKIITQFTLESLLMLVVSTALAAPVALRLMKGAVPALFTEEGADSVLSASSTFSSISTEIAEKTIDQTALINGLNYVSSDYIRIAGLLLLMAACCTIAVWVCTKKFSARNLLND